MLICGSSGRDRIIKIAGRERPVRHGPCDGPQDPDSSAARLPPPQRLRRHYQAAGGRAVERGQPHRHLALCAAGEGITTSSGLGDIYSGILGCGI